MKPTKLEKNRPFSYFFSVLNERIFQFRFATVPKRIVGFLNLFSFFVSNKRQIATIKGFRGCCFER